MNEFLKTRSAVDAATQWLKERNFTESGLSCKNWELAEATSQLEPNKDILDMGCDGSYILHNAVRLGMPGRKTGIDLLEVTGTNKAEDVEYFKGNLMSTGLEDESFDQIYSLSVIEHQVDYALFAKEVSRLLRSDGKLIVSFDYWPTKIDTSLTKLYSLDWNVLDSADVIILMGALKHYGLELDGDIDWTIQDAVINTQYCSPASGVSYTFGILKFIKK